MYNVTVSVHEQNKTSSQLYFYINFGSDTNPVLGVDKRRNFLLERTGDKVRVHLFETERPGTRKVQIARTGNGHLSVPISMMRDMPNEEISAQPLPVDIYDWGFEITVTYDLLQALMTPKAPRSLNANPDVLSIKHAAGSKIPFTKQEIQDILHEEIRKAA